VYADDAFHLEVQDASFQLLTKFMRQLIVALVLEVVCHKVQVPDIIGRQMQNNLEELSLWMKRCSCHVSLHPVLLH